MKKAVLLMLSLFSALSLMFLSCSTDSSGGGSDPKFDVIVCDTKKIEKSTWERKSTEQVYICITSENYLTDLEVKNVYYTDELEDIDFVVVDKYVETAGVYRINLNNFTTAAGSYNCSVVVASKSDSNNKSKKTTVNFTVKITGSSGQDEVAVPEITKQPAAGKEYYQDGESIDALNVEATISKGSVAYQWYKDDNLVSGATSASYTPTGKGIYYVRVSNASDSKKYVDSNKVSIVVLDADELVPPSITEDLEETISYDKTSMIEALVIKAKADEGTTVNYQWYQDNNIIPSATSASYKPDAFGSYYCELWAVSGEKSSQKIVSKTVKIKESEIVITISGLSETSYVNEKLSVEAKINVVADSVTYQWYKTSGGVSSDSDEPISGAISASYTPAEAGFYKCKVTVKSAGGQEKTADNGGTCKVSEKQPDDPVTPEITTKPVDVTVKEGEKVELSVAANVTDGGALSYQWKKNGQAISGATFSTYSVAKAAASDAGTYTVVVTNTLNGKTATAEASATVTVSSGTGGANAGFDFLQ